MDEHKRVELERKRADEAEAELARVKRCLQFEIDVGVSLSKHCEDFISQIKHAESLAAHYAEALELACNKISESACFCPGDSNTIFACRLEPCQSPKCWRKHLLYEAQNA